MRAFQFEAAVAGLTIAFSDNSNASFTEEVQLNELQKLPSIIHNNL
jgi:hypothetical protein